MIVQVAKQQSTDKAGDEAAAAQRLGRRETKGSQRDNGDMKPMLASPSGSAKRPGRIDTADGSQNNTGKDADFQTSSAVTKTKR